MFFLLDSNGSSLDAVVRAAANGATVLTPTTRAARHITAAVAAMQRRERRSWTSPDVLPWGAWLHRTFEAAQVYGATEAVLLTASQERAVWASVIEQAAELLRPQSVSGEAATAWKLIHSYRIPLSAGAFGATSQSRRFFEWAKKYQQLTSKNGWTDTARAADLLAPLVPTLDPLLARELVLWGFDTLTPQQSALIAAVERLGIRVTHLAPEKNGVSVRRVRLQDGEAELRACAEWARQAIECDTKLRVSVIVPTLAAIRDEVERIFTEVLQPEFYLGEDAQRAFDISLGPPLASYPLVRTALLWLRWIGEPLRFTEMRELLLSPYLLGGTVEYASRAAAIHELARELPERISMSTLVARIDSDEFLRTAISVPRLRRMLTTALEAATRMPKRAPMSRWSREVADVLKSAGFPGNAGYKLDSTEFQAHARFTDLLSDVTSLEVVLPRVMFAEAVAELARAAASSPFAPENSGAPVQIMDAAEARGTTCDHLWVCGLEDQTWPPRSLPTAFVPVALQVAAGVPGASSDSRVELAARTLDALLAGTAGQAVLSYPAADGDALLRPTPLIRDFEEVSADELQRTPHKHWTLALPSVELESDIDEQAPAIAPSDVRRRGTTLLELQSICPFRAFAELRLGADACEEPAPGIAATTRGSVVERALQHVWEDLRTSDTLETTSGADLQQIIDRAIERAVVDVLGTPADAVSARIGQLERERLRTVIVEWLKKEKTRSRFEVLEHQKEIRFSLAGLELRGFIDRLDRSVAQGGASVILDYKTGGSTYNSGTWKSDRPMRPQLPFYAAALQSGGSELAGVAFAIVRRNECNFKGLSDDKDVLGHSRSNMGTASRSTLREQVDEWNSTLEKLVAAHLAGEAAVDPRVPPEKSNSTCTHCHLHALCRIDETNAEDDDAESANE